MRNVPTTRQSGFALVELVVVIGLLAVIAAIAYPSLSSDKSRDLDMAATNFAAAIRFARTESIRTGEPHGFRFLVNQYRIRVFRADTQVTPWTWIWDVYHPVDKVLYDYTFPAELTGSAPPVTHSAVYRGVCDREGVVYFDETGSAWCLEPETILLESFRFDFATDNANSTIALDGITGRVVAP